MNLWKGVGLVAVALALTVSVSGARAQSPEDLRPMLDRMQRLERDIRTLNLQLSRGTPPPAPAFAPAPVASPQGSASGAGAERGVEKAPALARLNIRLSALETDLRSSTGAMEDIGFQIQEIKQRLNKLVADIDYRLGALEGRPQGTPGGIKGQARPVVPSQPRLSAAPAPPPVQKIIPGQSVSGGGFALGPLTLGKVSKKDVAAISPTDAGKTGQAEKPVKPTVPAALRPAPAPAPVVKAPSVLPQGSPKDQYKHAFGLLRQANYDKAELALQEFIKLHPKDPLAGNARYWLGETYYVRAAYVQAAEVFLESYQVSPKGPKAPDSLLKLGMSLGGLDKKREACAAFDKIFKDFETISAGIRNTVTREKQKNGCK